MNLKNIILEVLDTTVSDYKIVDEPYSKNIAVYFDVDKENYQINFRRDVFVDELVTIDFQRWGGEDDGWNMSAPKGGEHNPAKILGSIVNLIKMVLQKYSNIDFVTFNTDKGNTSRIRLYDSIVRKAIGEGILKQADKNSDMYRDIIENYPAAWVLEVNR